MSLADYFDPAMLEQAYVRYVVDVMVYEMTGSTATDNSALRSLPRRSRRRIRRHGIGSMTIDELSLLAHQSGAHLEVARSVGVRDACPKCGRTSA